MVDITVTPTNINEVATENADPTQNNNIYSYSYTISSFTLPANDIYIIQLDYDKLYQNPPDVNADYNFLINNGENYSAVIPQTTQINKDNFYVTFNNLRANSVDVSEIEVKVTIIEI